MNPPVRTLLAAFAAVSTTALAETSLTMYGTLLPNVSGMETVGATATAPADRPNQVAPAAYTGVNQPLRAVLSASTSNWGIRGNEELGGGLSAWFQVESAINMDGAPPSLIASRNTAVGLAGPWGYAGLGQWDTPYKFANILIGSLRGSFHWEAADVLNTPGFQVPVTTTQGGRVNALADAAFNRRQGNSVFYFSPTVGGFSTRLLYSVGEGKTGATATTPAIDPTLFSALVTYQEGGLRLDYGYERHADYFGLSQIGGSAGATLANPSSADYANQIIATYRYDTWRFIASYERLVYGSDDATRGAVKRFQKDGWFVSVQPRFGAQQVWLNYGQSRKGRCEVVDGPCSTAGLGGKLAALGWSYSFSKRTEVYAAVFTVRNEASAQFTTLPALPTAPGADTRGADIGILHSF